MRTQIVKGFPREFIQKRKDRIQEALHVPFESVENPTKFVVDVLPDGTEVFFLKPGKEYTRKKPNLNDMTPNVGSLFTNFSFADIWNLLCRLRNLLSLESYKKLSSILYRVAYLLDFSYVNEGKVRFTPSQELLDEIQSIQEEADSKHLNVNILAFIHFIDILGWNDEMKTHANNDGLNYIKEKPRMGRINTIFSCMAIPALLQGFVDEVLRSNGNTAEIDFSIATDIAQNLSRSRGIHTLTNKELVTLFAPELYQ